jgi:polysaccharide pyruvyl transferase WcaK-like protein
MVVKEMSDRVAIWGWWQGRNLGDNWIKESMRKAFREFKPKFIPSSIMDFSPYDFVICGGGGLFVRDVPMPFDHWIEQPFGVVGLGAEFPQTNYIAHHVLRQSSFFYVRDRHTADCLQLEGEPNWDVSADMTFYDPLQPNGCGEGENLLFIWRDPLQLLQYPDFHEYIGAAASQSQWLKILTEQFQSIKTNSFHTFRSNIGMITRRADFIISGRYHGIVAAMQRRVPVIGIDICPKIKALMRQFDLEEYCLKVGDYEKIPALIEKARNEISDIAEKQDNYSDILRAKLAVDINYARREIDSAVSVCADHAV